MASRPASSISVSPPSPRAAIGVEARADLRQTPGQIAVPILEEREPDHDRRALNAS
jgi:hypothetical protein